MAYIGFRKLMAATLNNDGTYGTPAAIGKAISMTVTPNFAEASLYGDDLMVEHDEAFTDADLTLGSTYMPVAMYNTLFGHTVTTTDVTFDVDDSTPYVGIAAYAPKKVDGTTYYEAIFLVKCKMTEPEMSFETKGDSITYNTPEISGKAMTDSNGVWKYTSLCATEAAAVTWINSKFGYTPGT